VRKGEVFVKYDAEVSSRVVLSEELLILASCILRPMSRNSVLEEFSVRRFAGLQNVDRQQHCGPRCQCSVHLVTCTQCPESEPKGSTTSNYYYYYYYLLRQLAAQIKNIHT